MKYVILSSFIFLSLMSVVAWQWQPQHATDRILLTWVCDDATIRREIVDMFNEQSDTYQILLDPQNMGMEKVIVQSIAGVGPDLFDSYAPIQLMAYVNSDIAYDMTEEFYAMGMHPDQIWECTHPTFIFQDRIYGHPGNANAYGIWFNKDLFDAKGVPYPEPGWTWDDFIDKAQRLTEYDAQGRPHRFGFIGPWDPSLYESILRQHGAHYYTPEATRCILDAPEAIAAMQFAQDLIYEHRVMPTPAEETAMAAAGGWAPGALSLFGAGRGAMATGGRWWLLLLRDPSFAHMNFGAVPMPAGPTPATVGGGRATLINKKTPHLEGALEFIRFLHGEEFNRVVNEWADALPPVKEFAYTDEFLFNPDYPDEDFHEMWRLAAESAEPVDLTPFANGAVVNRIITLQTDLMKFGRKDAESAMRDAARQINAAIIEQISVDPTLYEQYMELVEQGAQPAWDRPEDAP
jgi:ABC-type glycerol-3-phosphate transport system substrate-binding protein